MAAVSGPYAAWISWCDAYAKGEDMPMAHLEPIDERHGPAMQTRILHHLNAAFVIRQKRWSTQLTRDLKTAGADISDFGRILVDARHRLRPFVALVRSPLLADDARIEFSRALTQWVSEMQTGFEEEARSDPSTAGQLLNTLKQHSLMHGLTTPTESPGTSATTSTSEAPRVMGRPIIR